MYRKFNFVMPLIAAVLLALVVAAPAAQAQDATAVVSAASKAMGGDNLKTLAFTGTGAEFSFGQAYNLQIADPFEGSHHFALLHRVKVGKRGQGNSRFRFDQNLMRTEKRRSRWLRRGRRVLSATSSTNHQHENQCALEACGGASLRQSSEDADRKSPGGCVGMAM